MQKNKNTSDGRVNSSARESTSVSHLDKEFAKNYRKWRSENSNPYGFFYSGAESEYTYRDGISFTGNTPELTEAAALFNVNRLVSIVATIYFVMLAAFPLLLPGFLSEAFGVDIGYDAVSGSFYGSSKAIIIFQYVTAIIEKILPMIIIYKTAKMPFKVMLPTRISNKPLFGISVPAILLIAAVGTMMMMPTRMIMTAVGVDMKNIPQTFEVMDSAVCTALSIILTVIVEPLFTELIIHGAILQLLRQFGDGYALVITSIITAICSEDIRTALFYFVFSAVIGYFTLRTGSVITAVIMRSAINMFFAAQSVSNLASAPNTAMLLNLCFVLLCLVIGMVTVITFLIKNNHKISLPLKETYLSEYEKLMCFLTDPLVIMLISAAFSVMILTAPFLL